jgi:hypothetical protein
MATGSRKLSKKDELARKISEIIPSLSKERAKRVASRVMDMTPRQSKAPERDLDNIADNLAMAKSARPKKGESVYNMDKSEKGALEGARGYLERVGMRVPEMGDDATVVATGRTKMKITNRKGESISIECPPGKSIVYSIGGSEVSLKVRKGELVAERA